MTNRLIRRLCAGLIACLVASTSSLFAADVCLMEEAPFLAKSQPIFEDALRPGWTIDPYGANYGAFNTVVVTLGLQYTRDWGVVTLERSVPLNPLGIKALVFRIRGVMDNDLQQLWVILKNWAGQWMQQVPVAEHMVTTSTGAYDVNTWYTVVIPMDVLNPSMTSFDSIVFMNGRNVYQFYLDDIWLVVGMEFPLTGYTAYTAPISSVMDHSMLDGEGNVVPFATDGVVTAYTGEVADGVLNSSDETCVRSQSGSVFVLDGNYDAPTICTDNTYLSYDGHPGIDWAVDTGTAVHAPADGEILGGDDLQCDTSTCWGTGKVTIMHPTVDHPGPYTTVFEHNSRLAPGLGAGSPVTAGDVVAYSGSTGTGSPHVHMSVRIFYDPANPSSRVYVDPYGWSGSYEDPHRKSAVSVPLWK